MNERIKELAIQVMHSDPKPHLTTELYSFTKSEFEKFAELIVRECISKIESQRSSGENTDQWTITRDMCYHNMMADLKEHFGVK